MKVAIVGAGAAGIGAAEYFYNEGMNDFVVLEARDRVGGRVQSVQVNNLINYLLTLAFVISFLFIYIIPFIYFV